MIDQQHNKNCYETPYFKRYQCRFISHRGKRPNLPLQKQSGLKLRTKLGSFQLQKTLSLSLKIRMSYVEGGPVFEKVTKTGPPFLSPGQENLTFKTGCKPVTLLPPDTIKTED